MTAAIEIDDVSKRFRLYKDRPGSVKEIFTKFARKRYEDFWALKDVSVAVEPGTVYGLIGHNGCGKSTLLRVMAGIHKPTSGRVSTDGRISALLELGAGFHPELTGRENVYLNAAILGLSRKQTDGLFDRIVDFSGLEPFIDSPVKHYSSGMFVRLGFSVAVHVDPQILLIDEVIAVGDEEFQRRCLDHLANLKASGVTIVLVTHGMGIVQNMCDHVTWMDHGVVKASGSPLEVVGDYLREVNDEEASRVAAGRDDVEVHESGRQVTIEGFELVNDTGTTVAFGLSGEPLAVRVHLRVDEPTDPPLVVLRIESESGIHIATAAMQEPSQALGTVTGAMSADFIVDRLPLAPGNYTVKLSVHEPRGQVVIDRFPDTPMVIRSGGLIVNGMFDLAGRWSELEIGSRGRRS